MPQAASDEAQPRQRQPCGDDPGKKRGTRIALLKRRKRLGVDPDPHAKPGQEDAGYEVFQRFVHGIALCMDDSSRVLRAFWKPILRGGIFIRRIRQKIIDALKWTVPPGSTGRPHREVVVNRCNGYLLGDG